MRILSRTAVAASLILALAASASAKPPEETLKPVKDALGKEIKARFSNDTLEKVADFLQDKSGVPFILDRMRLGAKVKTPVTLEADRISALTTLEWACRLTETDFDVQDGKILITTPEEALRPYLVTEIYDIRGLALRIPDYPGPDINLSAGREGDGGQGGALFGAVAESTPDVTGLTGDEIKDYLKLHVRKGRWEAGATIEYRNGTLLVTNTVEVQKEAADLIGKFFQSAGKMVAVDARFYLVPTASLEKALGGKGRGAAPLDAATLETLLAAAAQEKWPSLGTARTVCFNTQRVHVTATNDRSYLSDITIQIAGGAVGADPDISIIDNGIILDIRPIASPTNDFLIVDLKATAASAGALRTVSTVFAPGTAGGEILAGSGSLTGTATDEKKDNKATGDQKITGTTSTDGRIIRTPGTAPASATVELPDMDMIRFRTTLRFPSGGGAVLASSAPGLARFAGEGMEVVLVLRAEVVK
ncbi:MAG: hypothetical protein V1809_12280 [Planctomycetota bacterium]